MTLYEKSNEISSLSEKKEAAYGIILEDGLNAGKLFAKGTGETMNADQTMKSGTYNENDGVIICKIKDRVVALPYTDETMELIKTTELKQDFSVGVPHLNDAEYMWGNAIEREGNSIFQQWKALHQKYTTGKVKNVE